MTKLTNGLILALALTAPLTAAAQGLPFDPAPSQDAAKKSSKAKKRASYEVNFTYFSGDGPWRNAMRLEVDLLTGQAKVVQVSDAYRVLGETQLTKTELGQINRALSNAGLSEPHRRALPPWMRPSLPRPQGVLLGAVAAGVQAAQGAVEQQSEQITPPQLNLDRPDWILRLDRNGEEITIRGNDEALGERSGLKRLADTLRLTAERVSQPPVVVDPVFPKPFPLPFPLPRPFPPLMPYPITPFPPLEPLELLTGFAEWFGRFSLPGGPVAWGVNRAIREALEHAQQAQQAKKSLGASFGKLLEKGAEALTKGADVLEKGAKRIEKQQQQETEQQQEPQQRSADSKGILGGLPIR